MIDETATPTPSAGQRVPIEQLREDVIAALQTIVDPEIPINIYDLGLIYDVNLDDQGNVAIQMTLTAPGCPVAETFPETVTSRLHEVPGVTNVRVELVWDPPWTIEKLSDGVRLHLGLL